MITAQRHFLMRKVIIWIACANGTDRCLDLGGNVYFLAKVFSTDGLDRKSVV